MKRTQGDVNEVNPDLNNELDVNDLTRTDPHTGLPLPDPYLEYIPCPQCGEPEVEVLCYQTEVVCHHCGKKIAHTPPPTCGTYPFCKRGIVEEKKAE